MCATKTNNVLGSLKRLSGPFILLHIKTQSCIRQVFEGNKSASNKIRITNVTWNLTGINLQASFRYKLESKPRPGADYLLLTAL